MSNIQHNPLRNCNQLRNDIKSSCDLKVYIKYVYIFKETARFIIEREIGKLRGTQCTCTKLYLFNILLYTVQCTQHNMYLY